MTDSKLAGEFVLKKEASNTQEVPSQETPPENHSAKKSLHHIPEKRNMHFFSSLWHYPKNVVFQNQEADEDVVLVVRRDFITNLPWIISMILLFLLPIIIGPFIPFFFPNFSVSNALLVLTYSFYYVVVIGFTLLNFAIWYFNVGIITNKRIIDLDVPNILVRHLSEARLASIVDVSYSQVGGLRSYFDYGHVDLQTEALLQNIEFDRAPNPNFIRKVVGELIVNKPS